MAENNLVLSLLDEQLIRARRVKDGQLVRYTLPGLFVAMTKDEVRDFPALRAHQRHPWHAFLVQLAVQALHLANVVAPFETEQAWRDALLALTPQHPDGEAWHIVTPHDRPAFLQAPVPGGRLDSWKNQFHAADELDMLVTSRNHDLKCARMRSCEVDDWVMALVSLQTQDGYLGAGNWGISRMNGGFANRPALGAVAKGHWGRRWGRDVSVLLDGRDTLVEHFGFRTQSGIGLVWVKPWDGDSSLLFGDLDPFYIEICRRVRFSFTNGVLTALATGSKVPRIEAKARHGVTGDPWLPVDIVGAKALSIGHRGFDYQLAAELVFGQEYQHSLAQELREEDGADGIVILAQGVARGKGKTAGYHERRVPISPRVREMLRMRHTDLLARVASERVKIIGLVRSVLWTALGTLFDNGARKDKFTDSAKDKATDHAKPLEIGEDARFFDDLNAEIESDQPETVRLLWMLGLVGRANTILHDAFNSGPRSGEQLYRARAAALSRFHAGVRNEKTFPSLATYYRTQHKDKP